MSAADPHALLELAVRSAHAAGALLVDRFHRTASGVSTKSSQTDPVSDADRDAESLIAGLLRGARPDDAIVGEEGAGATGGSGLEWIVDPLDGTVNFLYGIPQWAVSIACRDDRGALTAVVHDPVRGETFSAVRGRGCTLDGAVLRLREPPPLARALVGTGFSYVAAERERQTAIFARVLPRARDVRRAGSAALDLAWVAAGRLDAFYEHGSGRVGPRRGRPPRAGSGGSDPASAGLGGIARGRARGLRGARRRARAPAPGTRGVSDVPQVAVLGAALDLGQGRRGVDMGPSAIRYAELVGRLAELGLGVHDLGTVAEDPIEALDAGDDRAKYLDEILVVCNEIAGHVEASSRAGELPLVLGGDHSLALGVFGGLARVHGPVATVWFDAHADCNTPATTPSGNVHGMGLSGALGWGGERFSGGRWPAPSVDEDRAVLIGVRALDPGERERLRESRVRVYTMSEIDRLGMEAVIRGALERVAGAAHVHVSLDMDVMDPFWAPGVGTAVRGGISYREAHLAMELLAESGAVDSLEVVEVNPILDRENMTGQLAVELICSALGQRIL